MKTNEGLYKTNIVEELVSFSKVDGQLWWDVL
jgi:hypothetical protein